MKLLPAQTNNLIEATGEVFLELERIRTGSDNLRSVVYQSTSFIMDSRYITMKLMNAIKGNLEGLYGLITLGNVTQTREGERLLAITTELLRVIRRKVSGGRWHGKQISQIELFSSSLPDTGQSSSSAGPSSPSAGPLALQTLNRDPLLELRASMPPKQVLVDMFESMEASHLKAYFQSLDQGEKAIFVHNCKSSINKAPHKFIKLTGNREVHEWVSLLKEEQGTQGLPGCALEPLLRLEYND